MCIRDRLTAGGLLLLPLALLVEPPLPALDAGHIAGFAYLAVIGAALTYILWFRGIARLGPSAATMLGFLSPVSAVALGWVVLGERLDATQFAGAGLVLASIWLSQRATRAPAVALSAKQGGTA